MKHYLRYVLTEPEMKELKREIQGEAYNEGYGEAMAEVKGVIKALKEFGDAETAMDPELFQMLKDLI